MSTAQLSRRLISYRLRGIGYLSNVQVVFNKRSWDGSAKANLRAAHSCRAWGVVFLVTSSDLLVLDAFEKGYSRHETTVTMSTGAILVAHAYVSTLLADDPRPFESYKQVVLDGAIEHGLPANHVAYLAAAPSRLESAS